MFLSFLRSLGYSVDSFYECILFFSGNSTGWKIAFPDYCPPEYLEKQQHRKKMSIRDAENFLSTHLKNVGCDSLSTLLSEKCVSLIDYGVIAFHKEQMQSIPSRLKLNLDEWMQ